MTFIICLQACFVRCMAHPSEDYESLTNKQSINVRELTNKTNPHGE